ncbi:MAG: methyl-accepting chemotaxis protein [Pseudomonadota bacterium]
MLIMQGSRALTDKEPRRVPLIGHLPIGRQYLILATLLVAFSGLTLSALGYYAVQVGRNAEYLTISTEMQMLSQRIAKGAQQAALGNSAAFRQLKESEDQFGKDLRILIQGGESLPPSPSSIQPALKELDLKQWKPTEKWISMILTQQTNLLDLDRGVAAINRTNTRLLELADQLVALKIQAGAAAHEVATVGQLRMLSQRMAKNANILLASDVIAPETSFQLGKDANTFRETLEGLAHGSAELRLSATADATTRQKLGEMEEVFKEFSGHVGKILQHMQDVVNAKQASRAIFTGSDGLLKTTWKLTADYQRLAEDKGMLALAALFAVLAGASLMLLGMANINEAKRVALQNERENKTNQEAILRLLNEMGDLAEGNLTVRAKVTEDITGAIADSINFTIDELSGLVREINKTSEQVTHASQQAQAISNRLLEAAHEQFRDIEETSAQVTQMAQSVTEVSANAAEAAKVAKHSLEAAEKGAAAVQNSISGMNQIREQIQETSKRIKRLGESSQEISEIVELISDITEQTNILALNAAIQAASAGEAGRGFTVVAEEVQRLAERSGEATKRIGAIVKTIQTDTHDTVAAMETSTQGVIEWTKLSDAAGKALGEIGRVSHNMAELIESISQATQHQTGTAALVVENMQEIQGITKQTTEGTKQTTVSIGQLATLATDLRSSVAGFKLS